MNARITNFFQQNLLYQRMTRKLDSTYLRDKQTPISAVIKVLLRKMQKDELDPRANAVAFNLTLSVFPGIIFLFTLIPYFPIPDLDVQIMDFLGNVLPKSVYREFAGTLFDIVSRPRSSLLSLGFMGALYTATNGMMALMTAFNRSYRTIERRGVLRTRLTATLLTIMLAVVLVLAIVVLIVGNIVLKWLFEHDTYHLFNDNLTFFTVSLLQYGVVFLVFFLAIAIIYYVAPAIHKRWTFFSFGSIVASALAILVTHLFSFYISNFASYNKLYGSIGTFIGLMVWFYLLSFIILLGFEINASIDEAKRETAAKLSQAT